MSTHQPDDKREQRQTGAESQPGTEAIDTHPGVPDAADAEGRTKPDDEEEALDEALDESFPASDPPAHTVKTSKR